MVPKNKKYQSTSFFPGSPNIILSVPVLVDSFKAVLLRIVFLLLHTQDCPFVLLCILLVVEGNMP